MKFKSLFTLALALCVVAGTAVAGKGGPLAAGLWTGEGQAIYMDGTTANIAEVNAELFQEGNFIYGNAAFMVFIGDSTEPLEQLGQISGHISGNTITGVLGGCIGPAPQCLGGAVIHGKLSGNKLTGTVVDLSDGSTSTLTLYRIELTD